MSICTREHTKCVRRHVGQDFVPTRLLDIGPRQSAWPPSFVRVVDTGKEGVHAPYATLSHCWGRKEFVSLNDHNLALFTSQGVPWADMENNRNFADAAIAARRLHIRYLWIDSLCIVQKQAGDVDWLHEAPRMHHVYRNSYCNISASDSGDKDGGLFRERADARAQMVPPRYIPQKDTAFFNGRKWRVLSDNLYGGELLSGPLYSRAWVFQGKQPDLGEMQRITAVTR